MRVSERDCVPLRAAPGRLDRGLRRSSQSLAFGWVSLVALPACGQGSSTTPMGPDDAADSSDGASTEGGGASGEGSSGASGGGGSSGSSGGSTDASATRTGNGKTDQGCVTHADCARGYFCYLGTAPPTEVCGGPSGSCATCQGGMCPATFACSCLFASLCSSTSPCTDNGKVIVCEMQPQRM